MRTRFSHCCFAALIASAGMLSSCANDSPDETETKNGATGDAGDTATHLDGDQWTRLIGTPGLDGSASVAVDGQGHVYVGGWTDRGLGGRTYKGGEINDYVVKYSPSGARKWTRLVGVSGQDGINSVTADARGNVYVAGTTNEGLGNQSYNGGHSDGFLVKYGPSGTRKWTHMIGTSGHDDAEDVIIGGEGTLYVAGSVSEAVAGREPHGVTDGYVMAYDPSGARKWTRLFGTPAADRASSVTTDGQGNIYLGGSTSKLPGSGGLSDSVQLTDLKDFAVKYERSGDHQWKRVIGPSGAELGTSATTDRHGNLYIAGGTDEAFGGQSLDGRSDAYLVKYNPAGVRQWTRLFGSSGLDRAHSVTANERGSIYVVGGTPEAFGGKSYNGGNRDAYVVMFDGKGTRLWERLFGTSGSEDANGVMVGDHGSVYIVGQTDKGLDGQTYNGGRADGFLLKRRW